VALRMGCLQAQGLHTTPVSGPAVRRASHMLSTVILPRRHRDRPGGFTGTGLQPACGHVGSEVVAVCTDL
jgi:hypothetical protein